MSVSLVNDGSPYTIESEIMIFWDANFSRSPLNEDLFGLDFAVPEELVAASYALSGSGT